MLIVRVLLTMFDIRFLLSISATNSLSHFIITSPSVVGKYISIVNDTVRIEYSI